MRTRLLAIAFCMMLVMTAAVGLAGCAATDEPTTKEPTTVEPVTKEPPPVAPVTQEPPAEAPVTQNTVTLEQIMQVETGMTLTEVQGILGSEGSTTPIDQAEFDEEAMKGLSYLFWGTEAAPHISVGYNDDGIVLHTLRVLQPTK